MEIETYFHIFMGVLAYTLCWIEVIRQIRRDRRDEYKPPFGPYTRSFYEEAV